MGDENDLREVMTEVLQQNGFVVWPAADGEQALEIFRQNRGKIALVLTDVVMPRMGGVEAARAIREIDEYIPVIFQTGYGEDTQMDATQAVSCSDVMQKPVKIAELLQLIQSRIA
ncbi:MAG: response regulator [Mariprofundaceae bacterium]|nr:response regulator [Mariprofundaceae bacterium]